MGARVARKAEEAERRRKAEQEAAKKAKARSAPMRPLPPVLEVVDAREEDELSAHSDPQEKAKLIREAEERQAAALAKMKKDLEDGLFRTALAVPHEIDQRFTLAKKEASDPEAEK